MVVVVGPRRVAGFVEPRDDTTTNNHRQHVTLFFSKRQISGLTLTLAPTTMKIVRSFLLLTIMLVMMLSLTSTSNMVVAEESAAKGEEAEECASTEDGTCQANASDEPAATSNNNSDSATPEDSNCPSRPHIIKCAGAHLDLNHNGKIERAELQSSIDSLPWYARGKWGDANLLVAVGMNGMQ